VVAAAAAGGLAVAGCTGDQAPTGSEAAGSSPGSTSSGALAAVADIPDGGGLAVQIGGAPVVLIRSGDTVTAVSAKCTHQGCTVAPRGDVLACPCHGSTFDLAGKVTNGPADDPLAPVPVRVQGDSVLPA